MTLSLAHVGCGDETEAGARKVGCLHFDDADPAQGCVCDFPVTDSRPELECSTESLGVDTICCAGKDWPAEFTSCDCRPRPGGCRSTTIDSVVHCFCGTTETPTQGLDSCSPPPGGHCCRDIADGDCACQPYECRVGTEEVPSCEAAGYVGFSDCDSETHYGSPPYSEVGSCSDATLPSTTVSTGSGGACVPANGECEDSGDCTCGAGCLKTSNCESCSMYCVFPCGTDQDCIDVSEGLVAPFTHCDLSGLFGICE